MMQRKMMQMRKVLFGSDLHGQLDQFELLVKTANAGQFAALLLGGDICPRLGSFVKRDAIDDAQARTEGLHKQRAWFSSKLVSVLSECNVPVFLIFGNSDGGINFDPLRSQHESHRLRFLNNEWADLPGGQKVRLFGYPCVPPSSHRLKDFERYDLGQTTDLSLLRKFTENGFLSLSGQYEPGSLRYHKTTIQQDLAHLAEDMARHREEGITSIWMTHAPPYNTCADTILNETHVGSRAIRQAIEQEQPLCTLHGHIHESVDASGRFMDNVGRTVVMTSGHDFHQPDLACLEINLENPLLSQRLLIPI